MLDVIRKSEYFELLDKGLSTPHNSSLKGIQDGWILSQLASISGKRILEVGGGNSRVLPKLRGNDLWNAEKFEGVGHGPTTVAAQDDVRIVRTFMGEFSSELPEFDTVFSISVIEHIPFDGYGAAFRDMARCLVPGGTMYHAIDLPLANQPLDIAKLRICSLIQGVEDAGLQWLEPPAVGPDIVFSCDMATNSDLTMWSWAKISEASRGSTSHVQIVTLKLVAKKEG